MIEDCAQAYLASSGGRTVGTIGTIGCFSLQQGKHITTGEGGLVVTDDPAIARRMELFINKAWGYGDPEPDHYFLALNYRMSELQGAVALSQLEKLAAGVAQRRAMAQRLSQTLSGAVDISTPWTAPDAEHVFWKYCLWMDAGTAPDALAARLREEGIASAPRYIQKPAFQCAVLRDQKTFGNSRFPFNLARAEAVDYAPERFAGTFEALSRILVLPWNERYKPAHVDHLAHTVKAQLKKLRREPSHV